MLKKDKRGDLVLIPVEEGRVSVGQITETASHNVVLAIFPDVFDPRDLKTSERLSFDEPIFLAETMDAKIRGGEWAKFGHRSVSEDIPRLIYKVLVEPEGRYYSQDINGDMGTLLSSEEADLLRVHKSFSPALVEAAVRAFHGLIPWHPAFEDLVM